MKQLASYIEAKLYNGPVLTCHQASAAGISVTGCEHRGTSTCHHCPYEPVFLCAWCCASCDIRELCRCGTPEMAPYRPQERRPAHGPHH